MRFSRPTHPDSARRRRPAAEQRSKLHAKIAEIPLSDGAGQDFAARFFAQTQSFSFDKQGRVGLNAELLSHAGIAEQAVLVGAMNKFSLPAPRAWITQNASRKARTPAPLAAGRRI